MEEKELIEACRRYLGDGAAEVFTDEQLRRWIARSVDEYLSDSGRTRGEFPVFIDEKGECPIPEDFTGFQTAYNDIGDAIVVTTANMSHELSPSRDGAHIQTIHRDFSDDGFFRVSPIPRQEVIRHDYKAEGVYGIVTQLYGTAFGSADGATTSFIQFSDVGSVIYYRKGILQEIRDIDAIIYGVLAQAYGADTDLENAKLATAYAQMFKHRVGTRQTLERGSAFAPRTGNFY